MEQYSSKHQCYFIYALELEFFDHNASNRLLIIGCIGSITCKNKWESIPNMKFYARVMSSPGTNNKYYHVKCTQFMFNYNNNL